jgi:hypothetical protein
MRLKMKPDESDIRIAQPARDDLPDLAVRILSDFARIVAAEARLLESNIVGAAQSLLDRVYIASTLIVLAAAGVLAILGSVILLLHHWLPWWQVLGVVGVAAIVVAEVLRRTLMPAAASPTTVSLPN